MEGFHHTCTFLIAVVIVFGYISRSEADCPTPTNDTNGGHDGSNYTQTAEITYTCSANYGLATGTTVIATCQGNDTWSITAPTCLRDCTADPYAPSNGAVTTSTHLEGDTVTYSCDSTYVLNGSATAMCTSGGNWDNTTTTCLKDCGTPTDASNGGHTGADYTETQMITYTCDANYVLGSSSTTATCENTGLWSSSAPDCKRDCTADPSAPGNGAVTNSTHLEGDTITYSCDSTYGLNGSATATCTSGGTWDNTATCVEDCGQPPALTNGQFTAASTIKTSTGTYTCNQGYTLNGTASRTCQTDRTWDGTAPTCQEAAESSANGVYSRFTAVLLSTCLIIFFQTTMTWK